MTQPILSPQMFMNHDSIHMNGSGEVQLLK